MLVNFFFYSFFSVFSKSVYQEQVCTVLGIINVWLV